MKKVLKYLPAALCIAIPLTIAGVSFALDAKSEKIKTEINSIELRVANKYTTTQEYKDHVQEESEKLNKALEMGVITQEYYDERADQFLTIPYIIDQVEKGQNIELQNELAQVEELENAKLKYDKPSNVLTIAFPIGLVVGLGGAGLLLPLSKEQEKEWLSSNQQNSKLFDASVTWGDDDNYKDEDDMVADRMKECEPTYLKNKKEEKTK